MALERAKKLVGLFKKKKTSAERIEALKERSASLAADRDKIYDDVGPLERREAELLQQGKDSENAIQKKRLAAQIAQLRRDITRQNTRAAMLTRQVDIINTDIHNLTLIEQGDLAQLSTVEEITDNAVKAEEMLERLSDDAELASTVCGLDAALVSEEEEAILREFEGEEEEPVPAKEEQAAEPAESATQQTAEGPDEKLARLEQRLAQSS